MHEERTMNPLNRRHFLFASSGAAAGTFAVPGLLDAAESGPADFPQSGLVTGQPKPLKHQEIPGFLSAAQIAPHHTAHYAGALKAVVAADAKLEESTKSGAVTEPAAFAHLKRLVNSRGNSVVLHEFYFDGLAPKLVDPTKELRTAIEQRFGSLEKWSADFIASAKEAAGWAMLVKHPVNGKLYNVVSDEHAMGVLWMAVPIVVIDTYEHAYYVDYQNRKAEYVEKFMSHIDWDAAALRFRKPRV
jgi:superoxide dismutase, Fe-Mn family